MPIAATASILTNTGAANLVEGLQWMRGSTSGATGEIEEQQPKWSSVSLGSQTMTANRFPGFTTANGFSANLEASEDVLDNLIAWDFPFLPDEAGTLTANFTCKDEDGSSDTDSSISQAITAASGYTQIYLDAAASNTEGEIYSTLLSDSASTSIDAIAPETNLYQRDFVVRKGTLSTDGSGALKADTQDGVGQSIATLDYGVEAVVLESTVRFTNAAEINPCGFALRYSGGTSWYIVGLDIAANEAQVYNRNGFSIDAQVALDTLGTPVTLAINTDYVLKVTDSGSEIRVYIDGQLALAYSTTTYQGSTEFGFGAIDVGGGSSGNFVWKDFSFGLLNDGSGASGDSISDIDTLCALMDTPLDSVMVNVTSGTYHPSVSIPCDGTNVVWRWATSGTLVNLDTDLLDRATPLFNYNGSNGTLRRCTIRGFNILASDAITDAVDMSSASIVDTATDSITVSSTLYDAASDDDPIYYGSRRGNQVSNLPGGLAEDTVYYVSKQGTNTIKLLASPGGSVVNITSLSDNPDHVLVLNGRKNLVSTPSGQCVDMCFADIELDSSVPDYATQGWGGTSADGSRLAYIRVKTNGVKTVRGWIGTFVSTSTHTVDVAIIDCEAAPCTTERPHRFNLGQGRFTFAYNYVLQTEYGAKNPLRVQANERSTVYASNLVGTPMSVGGDGGDAQHVRIEQCHLNGVDVYDVGAVQFVSCIVTDELMKSVSGSEPTGGQYPGAMGINRDATCDDRLYVGNVTFVANGAALNESNNIFGKIEGVSDANVESNVLIENCVYSLQGNTAANAYGFMNLDAAVSSSIFTNNTIPEDSETAGQPTIVGRINSVNQSEAQFTANAATSGTTYAAVTLDSSFVPTGGGTGTVANGVFNDAYGSPWTPGENQNRGGVDADSTPPTVVNLTPADNATGVSEAQTISMQFSEDMKVGTGTIELRQVAGDTVLDSINAADATINISSRDQVTLTGLALTGVSGAVYVYIPSGAFSSLTTSIPFAGYTTNTDWNFTVGTTGGERSRDRSRLR